MLNTNAELSMYGFMFPGSASVTAITTRVGCAGAAPAAGTATAAGGATTGAATAGAPSGGAALGASRGVHASAANINTVIQKNARERRTISDLQCAPDRALGRLGQATSLRAARQIGLPTVHDATADDG